MLVCFPVPGVVEQLRALATGTASVRVTWLAPAQRAGRLTHYTLFTRELGKYAISLPDETVTHLLYKSTFLMINSK